MYKEDEQIIINFVTILILVDGFLQFIGILSTYMGNNGHNPYFSRWFSAIEYWSFFSRFWRYVTILILVDGFLQFLKKWRIFISMRVTILILVDGFLQSEHEELNRMQVLVTILILVDGFLQFFIKKLANSKKQEVTILILVDGFLQ